LPLMESMAMGLPTVATAWGGQTEFMNGLNSYLVDVEDFVQAEEGANWLHGQKWAEPSLAHLRSVMRYVFSNKAQAQAKGRRAAADVRKRFGMKPVADILMARLDSIAKQLSERHETIRGPL
jgi:glycosyltransferase involved in cell wall biosynthesis